MKKNKDFSKKIFCIKKEMRILLSCLGARNCRKNLHKHPGPLFQMRPGGLGCFSIAMTQISLSLYLGYITLPV